FQECLSNAIKHSNASSFRIVYEKRNHLHRFIIQDNGVGFDQKSINLSSIKSNGLLNIQERVSFLSGKLSFQSEINKGVKIIIEI
ncbi:MAG: sensor histidine kinase, partial [Fluviicola sp.]